MTKELIDRAASRYAEEAKSTYGEKLYRVILYGSCARGDFDDESDMDIMILLDVPKESISDEMDKAVSISSRLDLEFDYDILFAPVVETKNAFLKYQKALPFFRNVLEEGIVYV